MQNARRAEVEITYEGKDITTPVNEYLKSFSYTDIASGESDRVQIDMHDVGMQWMDAWIPNKGDRMNAVLALENWGTDGDSARMYCGEFQLDEMSFKGRPTSVGLGAVSIPRDEPFNAEEKMKTWESVTVRQIAQEISSRAGVALYYEAEDILIETIEQNEQTDCKFLYSVCADYGLAMKVYANRIIIFDEEAYENKPCIRDIDEKEMAGWSYKSTMAGTYTGAVVSYTDPNNEKEYEVVIGGGKRILRINENVDSIEDAERKGTAKLNNENKKAVSMKITMMADARVKAAACINVTGLGGKLGGKYYIDKVTTKKGGGSICQMTLDAHKVVPRIKGASVRAAGQEAAGEGLGGTAYTVVHGDTLWKIAKQFYGSGQDYSDIYNANMETIESTAKGRGKKDSSHGHWIFPGTVLTIPAKEREG